MLNRAPLNATKRHNGTNKIVIVPLVSSCGACVYRASKTLRRCIACVSVKLAHILQYV